MNMFARTIRSSVSLLKVAVPALCGLALTCAASGQPSQILEIYDASLTTYKATSASSVQGIQPTHLHRGVNIDGSMRSGSMQGWACAGNPFGEGWSGNNRLGDVRLDTGTYNPTEIDLALPSIGVRWVIGRTHNGNQLNGSSVHDSNSYQGKNWMQSSQPELKLYSAANHADDVLYIIYGADRFLEFRRTSSTSNYWKGKNGTAGVIKHNDEQLGETREDDVAETYDYYDQNGTVTTFWGPGNLIDNGAKAWQISRITDASGSSAYVSTYGTGGRIAEAFDPAGRRYTYTYTTLDSVARLTQVKAEKYVTSTWTDVGRVDYDYYTGSSSNGDNGNLKLVTITTPMSSGSSLVQRKYYRYYTGAWVAVTNPGHANTIKMVLHYEGARRYDYQDATFDDDFAADNDATIKPYTAAYFEYTNVSSGIRRISKAIFNGECGCSGGTNGTYEFSYSDNGSFSGSAGYDTAWLKRVVVKQPDDTYFTQYFDETGQPVSRVITASDPATSVATRWATEVSRDAAGLITQIRTPAANDSSSGYTHSSGALVGNTTGLIRTYVRETSGDLIGFLKDRKWKVGTSGTEYFDGSMTYTSHALTFPSGSSAVVRPVMATNVQYTQAISSGTSGVNTTNYTFAWHSTTSTNVQFLRLKSIKTEAPEVTLNGPGGGTRATSFQYFNSDATPSFGKAPDGIISFSKYDSGTAQVTMSIQDVNTGSSDLSGVTNPDTGVLTSTGAIHNKTTYTYDNQGRLSTVTHPDTRPDEMHYTQLADRRKVTLGIHKPRTDVSGGSTLYAPVDYTISNHAGKSEAQAQVGLSTNPPSAAVSTWIVTSATNPIAGFSSSVGTLIRLSTSIYNSPGNQLTESAAYFDLASFTWPGTSGTHYDASTYNYDAVGRRLRIVGPTGDISRTVYDTLGRAIEQWAGTNDTGDVGSPMSGTNNMTKVGATVYDGSTSVSGGNSYVTSSSQYPDGGTGVRTTTYTNDERGRLLLITSPVAPHTLNKYDNLSRATASAQYSSIASITPGTTDPSGSATNDKANRVAASETLFDERGQIYQSIRHKVTQSTGELTSGENITTDFWYDIAGRRIKVQGEELSKTFHDRLGRATHRFILGRARSSGGGAESAYDDANDVADDVVMEEHQTVYEPTSGNVHFTVSLLRHAAESTTQYGALDSNADADLTTLTAANVRGRSQITANWYDTLDRLTNTVAYGTNDIVGNGSATTGNFTRPASVPTGAADKLRTDYTYPDSRTMLQDLAIDIFGTYRTVTDANGRASRTWFDDGGRVIATIANYVDGDPTTGAGNDTDVFTRHAYTAGLRSKTWIDLDADNTEDSGDQVTTYVYGVTKGTTSGTSRIASNRLLDRVIHAPQVPMQSAADRTVTHAYNALGQEIYRKDQAGNIVEQEYDTVGRLLAHKATTIITGFDATVQRIESAYLARGMINTVTQRDGPADTDDATDQVKYHYDDWGNLTKFEQDVDSAIGGAGRDEFSVQYAYAKNTPATGRRTLRRSGMTMPKGTAVSYSYSGIGELSRVSAMQVSSVAVASYFYNGTGHGVSTVLNEPQVRCQQFDVASLGSYPDLDRFNRLTSNRWTKLIGSYPDFHDVDIAYDNLGNVVRLVDNVQKVASGDHAFDTIYTLDGQYRVTTVAEGNISGGITGTSISSGDETRTELWTLSQTGNFNTNKLDLDGNQNYSNFGGGEIDDLRNHNLRNEITDWRPGGSGGTTYTVAHDKVGNLTDDGRDYKFKSDAFGRVTTIMNQDDEVVADYRYNGVCMWTGGRGRILVEFLSGGTLVPGPWYWRCNDERGRVAAVYRDDDENPKEQFYHHSAGLGGYGRSSYSHSMILRDRDASTVWEEAADSTLEERRYYCQDFRGDVSTILTDVGVQVESVKFFTYGTPFGIPAGDMDADGDYDSADYTVINGWTTGYDVRGDLDLSGTVDAGDLLEVPTLGTALGRGVLSREDVANRVAWRGYETDGSIDRFLHGGREVLDSALGTVVNHSAAGICQPLDNWMPTPAEPGPWTPPINPSPRIPISPSPILPQTGCTGGFGIQIPTSTKPCDIVCTSACNSAPFASGVTICNGMVAITCICLRNMLHQNERTPDDASDSYFAQCIANHEDIHRNDIDCSTNDPSRVVTPRDGLPWTEPYLGQGCSECKAWFVTRQCVQRITCPTGDKGAGCRARKNAFESDTDHYLRRYCPQCIDFLIPPGTP